MPDQSANSNRSGHTDGVGTWNESERRIYHFGCIGETKNAILYKALDSLRHTFGRCGQWYHYENSIGTIVIQVRKEGMHVL